MNLKLKKTTFIVLLFFVLNGIPFSDGCEKLTITGSSYQTGISGLYIRSEPDRCGSTTDTWRQQNGNNLIYQLTDDKLWYIGPNNCRNSSTLSRSNVTSVSPLSVSVGFWQEIQNNVWIESQMRVQCYDDISDNDCLTTEAGDDYSGHAYVTITGKICQPWKSQSDCFTGIPDKNTTLAENYCRNPTGPSASCHGDRPWCYTGDWGAWEYCDIPVCGRQEMNCMKPLGMGNGDIRDDQITSSSPVITGYEPFQARINVSNARYWKGASVYDDRTPRLIVDFLRINRITKLYTQGIDRDTHMNTFSVLYSLDNLIWTGYSDYSDGSLTEFQANSGSETVPIYFKKPFSARWLIIAPRSWDWLYLTGYLALRMEIYGCPSTVIAPANSSTNITSAIIESNTRWSLANSPYVVRQVVTVVAGVTLTIEGGVKVVMDGPEAQFYFIGCLNLESVKGLEVTFVKSGSANLLKNVDDAYNSVLGNGIKIFSNQRGCSSLSLHDVIFNGVFVEFHTSLSSLTFNNINILNSKEGLTTAGSENKFSNMTINECKIEGNSVGLVLDVAFNTTIDSCRFLENDVAIKLVNTGSGSKSNASIDRSSFERNRYGISSSLSSYETLNITISRSSMKNHNEYGIYFYERWNEVLKVNLFLENCTLYFSKIYTSLLGNYRIMINASNLLGGANAVETRGSPYSISIKNSAIMGATDTAILIQVYIIVDSIDISGCTFSNNKYQQCIYVDQQGSLGKGELRIWNSAFINNTVTDVISINDVARGMVYINGNSFTNPGSTRDLNIVTPWKSGYVIQVSGNWWGSADDEYVKSRILDFYTDHKRAEANISTIYLSDDLSAAKDTQHWRDWNVENSTVGGRLFSDFVLSGSEALNYTYTVKSSIYVPRNMKLSIIGLTTLKFLQGRGITVEGTLEIIGEISERVNLEAFNANWGGLWFLNSTDFLCRNANIKGMLRGIEADNTSIDALGCSISGDRAITITATLPVEVLLNNCSTYSTADASVTVTQATALTLIITRSIITSSSEAIKISASYLDVKLSESEIKTLKYNYDSVLISGSYLNVSFKASNCSFAGRVDINIVLYSNGNMQMEFIDSNFSTDGYYGCVYSEIYAWGTYSILPKTLIKGNIFNCSSTSVYMDHFSFYNSAVIFEGNYFNMSQKNIFISMIEPSNILIKGNLFLPSSQGAVEIYVENWGKLPPGSGNDAVIVRNNHFSGSTGEYVVGLTCKGDYRSTMLLTENRFTNNSVTSVVTSTCPGLLLIQNQFENPLFTYDYNASFSSTEPSYAPRNYWNVTTYQEVSSRIYDYQDDPRFVPVVFTPWYSDASMTTVTRNESSFIRPGGSEIGGTLTEDVTLTPRDQPYTVLENIVIPFGFTLIIDAGIKLQFSQGGIDVKGRLLALGSDGNNIVMEPASKQSVFKGISFMQPLTDEVRQHTDGWWEMMVEGVWYLVCVYSEENFPKASADLLCRSAGYEGGAKTFQSFDCLSSMSSNEVQSACNRTLPSKSPYCATDNKYLSQCSFYECYGSNQKLLNLTCVYKEKSEKKVNRIVTKSGLYVSINMNNEITLKPEVKDSSEFAFTQPCLAENAGIDCVSISPLLKPGWYFRTSQKQISLEPKINPTNAVNFKSESSFYIREDTFLPGFVALESFSQPNHYVTLDNYNNTLRIQPVNESNSELGSSASFQLIATSSLSRKRRDVTDSLFDTDSSTQSILRYVDILSSSTGISLSGKLPQLQFVNIDQSNKNGITLNDYLPGNLTLLGCNISRSAESGIFIKYSRHMPGSSVNIVDSVISGSKGQGVSLQTSTEVNFVNCFIFGNAGIGIEIQALLDITVSILNCQLINNCPNVEYYSDLGQITAISDKGIFVIEGCLFKDATRAAINIRSTAVIKNNTITGHRPPYIKVLVILRSLQLQFHGNRLVENNANILLNVYDIQSSSIINITGNVFHNNTAVDIDNSTIRLTGDMPNNITFSLNSFSNPSFNDELDVKLPRGKSLTDLSLNYWNKLDYSAIISRIRCFYTDMQYAAVNIYPALLSFHDLTDLLIRPDNDENFFQDGAGGEVITSVIIHYRPEPYIFNRSIFVAENATLMIEKGVILKFQPNTGIYSIGNLLVEGSENDPVQAISAVDPSPWYGVVIDEKSTASVTRVLKINNIEMHDAYFGIKVLATGVEFKGLLLNGSQNVFYASANNITIIQSEFYYSQYGIYSIETVSNLEVINSTFVSNSYGIYLTNQLSVTVRNCQFEKQTVSGIKVRVSYVTGQLNFGLYKFTIAYSVFTQIPLAVDIIASYYTEIEIKGNTIRDGSSANNPAVSGISASIGQFSKFNMESNNFLNLPSIGLDIVFTDCYYRYTSDITVTINDNTFRNIFSTAAKLYYFGYIKTLVKNNTFIANNAQGPSAISLNFTQDGCSEITGSVNILQNKFVENRGSVVVGLNDNATSIYSGTDSDPINVTSNSFVNNLARDAVIYLGYDVVNINYNIFSNPQMIYDIKVGFRNESQQDSTNNWWGTKNENEIEGRIYDKLDDSNLGVVLYEPFLAQPEFTCTAVSNCSNHGTCVLPDTCECLIGWTGRDCSLYTCTDVNNCLQRGLCVGPNICECNEGWLTPDCSRATCYQKNNCSNRGICTAPNQCVCSDRYKGDNCSQCGEGYFGTSCLPCPQCVHGICDKISGQCVCDGVNWSGSLCDTCSPDFFGSSCLPLIIVAGISPTTGPDVGGTEIRFYGSNFPNVTTYRCRFDTDIVAGNFVSKSRIACITPKHSSGNVLVDLSISSDQGFPYTKFTYTYYALCPVGACGSRSSPPRGVCTFGTCVCNVPWLGDDCSIVGLGPVILHQRMVQLVEGQPLDITLNVTQGYKPLSWSLSSPPDGMTISDSSGRILWKWPGANFNPYKINVICSNPYGTAEMTFNLMVPPAYSVVLDSVPSGPFIQPQPVTISGKLIWINMESKNYLADNGYPVNVLINTSVGLRTVPVKAESTDSFSTRFYPQQNDAGLFQVDARHPADIGFDTQITWSVLGLSLQTNLSLLTGYVGEFNYTAFVTITNTGVDTLTSVVLKKIISPYSSRIKRNNSTMPPCSIHLADCPVASVIFPGDKIVFDFQIDANLAYSGYLGISVITAEGISRTEAITYKYIPRFPSLQLSPNSIQARVTKEKRYSFNVNVTNSGLQEATDVKVNLPQDPMLSVQSFGTSGAQAGQGLLILNSGESAFLVISVAPAANQQIGAFTGTIAVKSLETSTSLTFRFVVASTDRLNLIVRVEDEYTYFASDKPLLSGATVRLVSQLGGDSFSLVTGSSGIVVFENIREDYYSLYTTADRHIGDSRIIFATEGTGSNISVFLQRTAVTYSWSVTPVTFEDKYEIVLEADFETHVPIPVVTITPNQLDLNVLEKGLMPFIYFEITNHGLIAAKEFQFKQPPPDAHPFLRIVMEENIGDIPANTTLYVTATVIINETKRDEYKRDEYKGRVKGTSTRDETKRDEYYKQELQTSNPCSFSFYIPGLYFYICDDRHYITVSVAVISGTLSFDNCDVEWNRRSAGPGSEGHYESYAVSTSLFCTDFCQLHPLLRMVFNCYDAKECWTMLKIIASCLRGVKYLPIKHPILIGIGKGAEFWAESEPKLDETLKSIANNQRKGDTRAATLDAARWLAYSVGEIPGIIFDCFYSIIKIKDCIEALGECFNDTCAKQDRSRRGIGLLTQAELSPFLARRAIALGTYVRLGEEFIGDSGWFSAKNAKNWWTWDVLPVMDDSSDGGQRITRAELSQVLSTSLPDGVTKEMVETLLMRLNNTQNSWSSGVPNGTNVINAMTVASIIDEMENYTEEAWNAGYESISDWYLDGYNEFLQADEKPNEGVCAKVRIQILQKLVLTRSAFNARLVLDNGETMELRNIRVDIYIRDSLSKETARTKFAVGNATLTGLADVSGTGSLPVQSKGTAEWLIIPYSTAAPYQDVLYDIGGTLYYTVNGENISIPLFPDTVTVKPDPQLYINYFLEKFVYSDDSLTTDVVEPAIPFSLGILISNDGYGSAKNLEITSAQPQIIDNEKGLLVNFLITGAQLGNNSILPSLKINFGDIGPHSTKMARWIMTSSLSGIFSNYSATFKNINPLGDPELSLIESVKFHELLHVVRVDTPTDDSVLDFLVVDPNKLDVWPNLIYQSQDGLNPLNVNIGNVTNVTATPSTIKIYMNTTQTGWIYIRSDYEPVGQLNTVYRCRRSDGRQVIPEQNAWISKVRKNTYIHILDFIPVVQNPAPGMIYRYSYEISLVWSSNDAPKFQNSSYLMSIPEEANEPNFATVKVDNNDNPERSISYSLVKSDASPFIIDSVSGALSTIKPLDREQQDSYSIVVLGLENSIPPLTGTTVVVVQVTDINDNSPVFDKVDSAVSIEIGSPVGFVISVLQVSDKDAGDNGIADLSLEDSSELFELSNMTLRTKSSLIGKTGTYTVKVKASDRGVPPRQSEQIITITVKKFNLHAPVFSQTSYNVNFSESNSVGIQVVQLNASDADTGDKLRFELVSFGTIPFTINATSGIISNILPIDREQTNLYIFQVLVIDDGALPTGSLTGTANVTIRVLDVNDNAPRFPWIAKEIHISENLSLSQEIFAVRATDSDLGANEEISHYTLYSLNPTSNDAAAFKLKTLANKSAILFTVGLFDRETKDRYDLILEAMDGGSPPLSTNLTITVIIDDVNDNAPEFINTSHTVTIPRVTSINTVIYTVTALDKDIGDNAIITYTQTPSDYLIVQTDTGAFRLNKSLSLLTENSLEVVVTASDGVHTSPNSFTLTVLISDVNTEPPRFGQSVYQFTLNESLPESSLISILTASDPDSIVIYYFITAGNNERKFSLDPLFGRLTLAAQLDYEMTRAYNLTIMAIDGSVDDMKSLNTTITVNINILDTNEQAPNNFTTTTQLPSSSIITDIYSSTMPITNEGVSRSISSYISVISYRTDISAISALSEGPTSSPTVDYNSTVSTNNEITSNTSIASSVSRPTDISGVSAASESSTSMAIESNNETGASTHEDASKTSTTATASRPTAISDVSAASASSTSMAMEWNNETGTPTNEDISKTMSAASRPTDISGISASSTSSISIATDLHHSLVSATTGDVTKTTTSYTSEISHVTDGTPASTTSASSTSFFRSLTFALIIISLIVALLIFIIVFACLKR